MTKQQIFKKFVKYCTLNVLGMIGISLYVIADTFFVARDMGAVGLAALNLALPIYGFMRGISSMLGMGGGAKFSILRAQKKEGEANSIFTLTVIMGAFFSLVYLSIGLFFSKSFTMALGASEEVFSLTHVYLKTLLVASPLFIFSDIFIYFLRNDKNPKLAMISMLVGSSLNIILDYIFIFIFGMGMFGAVFATVISTTIEMFILLFHVFQKKNTFHLTKFNLKLSLSFSMLAIGFPSFLSEFSSSIVFVIFNLVILNLLGNIGVAAYGIITNVFFILTAIYFGISQGLQPLASKAHGHGDHESLKRLLLYAFTTIFLLSSIIYAVIYFFAPEITYLFNTEKNLELQGIAIIGLKIYFISVFFMGFNGVVKTFFSSIEKNFSAHLISLLSGLIIIIPMTYLLSHFYGIYGVWTAFPASEFLTSLIAFTLILLLKKNYLKKENLDPLLKNNHLKKDHILPK